MNNTFGTPGGGYPGYPADTPDPSGSAREKGWYRWGAGAVLLGFLVGGGITLAALSGGGTVATSGGGTAATSGGGTAAASGGGTAAASGGGTAAASGGGTAAAGSAPGAQAAALNNALSAAASDSSTVPVARVRWALGRLRLLGGVDGTVTFHNKTGFHTLSFERGTIQSVSGSDVVIKASDGTTWTWQIVSDTVVRKNGSKTTTSALSAGETVFAGGPVVSGARDARLIVIRPAGSSGSVGSQSAQTSLS